MISARRSGFTLIEILIVVGIIGLLVTVLLAVLLGAMDKGDEHMAKDFVNNRIPAAMTTWQQKNGLGSSDFPRSPNMKDGKDYIDGNIELYLELVKKPVDGGEQPYVEDSGYVKGDRNGKPFFQDPWGNPYIYRNYSQKRSKSGNDTQTRIKTKYSEAYDVISMGPDGLYETDDDIAKGKQ